MSYVDGLKGGSAADRAGQCVLLISRAARNPSRPAVRHPRGSVLLESQRGGLGSKGLPASCFAVGQRDHRQERGSGRNGNAELIGAVVAEAAPEDAVDEVGEFSARHKRLRRGGQEVPLRADHGGGQGTRILVRRSNRQVKQVPQLLGAVVIGDFPIEAVVLQS